MNPTSPDISGDQWLGCSQLCSQIFPIHPQILPTLNLCRVDISSPKSSCEAKAAICMLMHAYACLCLLATRHRWQATNLGWSSENVTKEYSVQQV